MELLYDIYNRLNFVTSLLIAIFMVCWRFPKRKYFVVRVIAACAVAVAVSLLKFEILFGENSAWSLVIKHLAMFMISFGVLAVCFKCNVWVMLLGGVIGYCLQHIAAHVYILFYNLIWGYNAYAEAPLFIFCCVAVYLTAYFWFVRRFEKGIEPTVNDRTQAGLAVIVFLITICLTIVGVVYAFVANSNALLAVVCSLSVFSCILGIWVEMQMLSIKQNERDMAIVNLLLKQQAQQYAAAKESVNIINIKCHDLRHRFNDGTVDEEEKQSVKTAIDIYDSRFETGSEALDVVLTEKNLYCNTKNIRLTCLLDGTALSTVKPSDIYALFGNALDNAIESVEKLDEERRSVSIVGERNGNIFKVTVENYYDGEVLLENGMPVTRKDKNYHGFGMKSMQAIVQKYGGELSVAAKDGIFRLNIVLISEL